MADKILNFVKTLTWQKAGIIVGLAAAFFYFSLDTTPAEDLENNIQALNGEVGTLKSKVKEAKEFEAQYEDRKKKYVQLVKELQAKQGSLPKQFYLPDLLSDLLKEAKQLEVEIVSITPDKNESQGDLYSSLGFNLDLRGTFVQVFIFLDRMAHMKRIADVKRFSIERDTERSSVTLGGEDGAFASSALGGGKTVYAGVKSRIQVLTYRYSPKGEAENKDNKVAEKGAKK